MALEHIRQKKILVVDDEKPVRDVIVKTLSKAGYLVSEAEHGIDAVLLAVDIDLLITDIQMPRMNGLELAAYLRQYTRLDRILIISGYTDLVVDKLPGFDGIVSFMPKPFPTGALLAKVRELLDWNSEGSAGR